MSPPHHYRPLNKEGDVRHHTPCSYLPSLILLLLLTVAITTLVLFLKGVPSSFMTPWVPLNETWVHGGDYQSPAIPVVPSTLAPNSTTHGHHKSNISEVHKSENSEDNGKKDGKDDFSDISLANLTTSTLDINQTETAELRQRLIEIIQRTEKYMEHLTGLEGELLVPIFMLVSLIISLSILTLCSCLWRRRREARRRKLFGKIITDLQTGDSNTVLLNQSDLDD